MIIEINGPSAVGKTSVGIKLQKKYNAQVIDEMYIDNKNPYKKYKDEESFF